MPLDYSQKRLVSTALHGRNKKLSLYAFYTGVLSTLVSLAGLIVQIIHRL